MLQLDQFHQRAESIKGKQNSNLGVDKIQIQMKLVRIQ